MSTLERTKELLDSFSDDEIGTVYSFATMVHFQRPASPADDGDSIDDILSHITGIVPNDGRGLDDYRSERMHDRYAAVH